MLEEVGRLTNIEFIHMHSYFSQKMLKGIWNNDGVCRYGDSNPIYGEARNPHSKLHSPGGSSSGEGALVGAGASMVGLGNDTGGSGRVPAHFSGCFSLKPTSGRLR